MPNTVRLVAVKFDAKDPDEEPPEKQVNNPNGLLKETYSVKTRWFLPTPSLPFTKYHPKVRRRGTYVPFRSEMIMPFKLQAVKFDIPFYREPYRKGCKRWRFRRSVAKSYSALLKKFSRDRAPKHVCL